MEDGSAGRRPSGDAVLSAAETDLRAFFEALRLPDQRAAAVAGIQDLYREWVAQDGFLPSLPLLHDAAVVMGPAAGGEKTAALAASATASTAGGEGASGSVPASEFLRQLPTVLRLSLECPYAELRQAMLQLLQALREWGRVPVPSCASRQVSAYIDAAQVVPIDTSVEEVRLEFENAFDLDGRVSHMTRLMAYHPQYLTVGARTARPIILFSFVFVLFLFCFVLFCVVCVQPNSAPAVSKPH